MARTSLTVRKALALLLAATLLPMALGGVLLLVQQWRAQAESADHQLRTLAMSVALAVDQEFATRRATLDAAAATDALREADWPAFHAWATRLLVNEPGTLIAVTADDGQLLMNTAVPLGRPLPNLWAIERQQGETVWEGRSLPVSSQAMTRRVFDSGRVQHSDLYYGVSIQRPALALALPGPADARQRVALTMAYPPAALQALLARVEAPGLLVEVLDRQRRVVASLGPGARALAEVAPPLRAVALEPGAGRETIGLFGIEDPDGTRRVGAVTRSTLSGYEVRVSLPRALAYGGGEARLGAWAALAVAVLALAGFSAAWFATRLNRGLRALAGMAAPPDGAQAMPGWRDGRTVAEIDLAAHWLIEARQAAARRQAAEAERERAELQRAGAEAAAQRLRRLVDALFAFVGLFERDGRLVEINRAPLDAAGLQREQVVGRLLWELPWWGQDPEVTARVREAARLAALGEVQRFDLALSVPGLGHRTYDLQIAPIDGGDGDAAPRHLVASGVDITDRVAAVQALREAHRQKDEFIATLAHELRNPLAPIRHGAELIALIGPADPRIARATAMIDRQSAHLARLVDDLLDISRLTLGTVRLQLEPLDLREAVAAGIEAVRPAVEAAGHRFVTEIDTQPMPMLGDATRLSQIVANLLGNAVKFTPAGGRITLQLQREASFARLVVEDDGIGIAPAMLERVFEPFVQERRDPGPPRTGPHAPQPFGGLGIGLALSAPLVQRHGGSIRAESAGPGRGARFVVELPLAPVELAAPAAAARGPRDEAPQLARPAPRALIVDDNADAASTLCEVLAASGVQAETVASGSEALARVAAAHYDAIVLDIGLPDLSGVHVATRLRDAGCTARLVALSGWETAGLQARAAGSPFDEHLTKPASVGRLLALLREAAGAPAEALVKPER